MTATQVDVLKELMNARFDHIQRLIDERHTAMKDAMTASTTEVTRRLDGLNGEADRLKEMQATYVPREVYETAVTDLSKSVTELRVALTANDVWGKVLTASIAGTVSIVVAFGGKLLH